MSCVNQIQEVRHLSRKDVLEMLMSKILCEVKKLMNLLYKGYRPKIQFILEEIMLVDILSDTSKEIEDNFLIYVFQYYLNNEDIELDMSKR